MWEIALILFLLILGITIILISTENYTILKIFYGFLLFIVLIYKLNKYYDNEFGNNNIELANISSNTGESSSDSDENSLDYDSDNGDFAHLTNSSILKSYLPKGRRGPEREKPKIYRSKPPSRLTSLPPDAITKFESAITYLNPEN